MKLVALMPCRNEDWIVGASLRAALMWCDIVVVLNHASTDRTAEIVSQVSHENPGRVRFLIEKEERWSEMEHRQRLLDVARFENATHIALVDADEILTGNLLAVIRREIQNLQPGGTLSVGMLAMWRSLDRYRVGNSIWANRFDLTLAFADDRNLHWTSTNGYEHHHRQPHGSHFQARGTHLSGGVMHLQWASWRRLIAKHAKYKMDERLKYPQKPVHEIEWMYSLALDETGIQCDFAPSSWWAPYYDLRDYINLEADPWQERQCKAWIAEYGADKFKGLDLFGIV